MKMSKNRILQKVIGTATSYRTDTRQKIMLAFSTGAFKSQITRYQDYTTKLETTILGCRTSKSGIDAVTDGEDSALTMMLCLDTDGKPSMIQASSFSLSKFNVNTYDVIAAPAGMSTKVEIKMVGISHTSYMGSIYDPESLTLWPVTLSDSAALIVTSKVLTPIQDVTSAAWIEQADTAVLIYSLKGDGKFYAISYDG